MAQVFAASGQLALPIKAILIIDKGWRCRDAEPMGVGSGESAEFGGGFALVGHTAEVRAVGGRPDLAENPAGR
jgi:hypothetical protein